MKISIIGSGSWGTALAIKAVTNLENDVWLYCRNVNVVEKVKACGENKEFLPGVKVPEAITLSTDLVSVMDRADLVLIVTPSQVVRETLRTLAPLVTSAMTFICCSKGLELSSGKSVFTILEEELSHITSSLGVLSGPNHAEEIARNLPAATVVGATTEEAALQVQKAFSSESFRVYTNGDIHGIELAGATKNIIALAAGIADGLALGDNLKAALLTRGLHEMTRFGVACGAMAETYYGLAGMGDLIATCMSVHSRNRSAGLKLAKGMSRQEIIDSTTMVIEGFVAVDSVHKVAKEKNVEMPITESLFAVLHEGKSPKEALIELMLREPKPEALIN